MSSDISFLSDFCQTVVVCYQTFPFLSDFCETVVVCHQTRLFVVLHRKLLCYQKSVACIWNNNHHHDEKLTFLKALHADVFAYNRWHQDECSEWNERQQFTVSCLACLAQWQNICESPAWESSTRWTEAVTEQEKKLQTQKGSNERLFILTWTHSMLCV